jgi:hypothetical protein
MLGWALTFLVIALIAAALGFGGVAGAATGIAKTGGRYDGSALGRAGSCRGMVLCHA